MNAALSLHTVLSLRLDAIDAYRLAHAYRDEELQKYADRLASRASLYGDTATVGEVIKDLRDIATRKTTAEESAPDFFQPGHTYAREHHAATIRFLVRAIDKSPDGVCRVAFGWRIEDGDVTWSPFDLDDIEGWTDVTEDGAR